MFKKNSFSVTQPILTGSYKRFINTAIVVEDDGNFSVRVQVKEPIRFIVEVNIHKVRLDAFCCDNETSSLVADKRNTLVSSM